MKRRHSERGSAMLETAIVTPILLLLTAGIFEVGRAYQTWQVVTNAAREGARVSITPSANNTTTKELVKQYMTDGQLGKASTAVVNVDRNASITVNGTTFGASQVTVEYPFEFTVLGPIARLVAPDSTAGEDFIMRATALMRNEAP